MCRLISSNFRSPPKWAARNQTGSGLFHSIVKEQVIPGQLEGLQTNPNPTETFRSCQPQFSPSHSAFLWKSLLPVSFVLSAFATSTSCVPRKFQNALWAMLRQLSARWKRRPSGLRINALRLQGFSPGATSCFLLHKTNALSSLHLSRTGVARSSNPNAWLLFLSTSSSKTVTRADFSSTNLSLCPITFFS